MTDYAFDRKYNSTYPEHVLAPKHCAGCATTLSTWNTPGFGIGKLSDNSRVCSKCTRTIARGFPDFIKTSKQKYDSALVHKIMQQSNSFAYTSNKQKSVTPVKSTDTLEALKKDINTLITTNNKKQQDIIEQQSYLEHLKSEYKQSPSSTFLPVEIAEVTHKISVLKQKSRIAIEINSENIAEKTYQQMARVFQEIISDTLPNTTGIASVFGFKDISGVDMAQDVLCLSNTAHRQSIYITPAFLFFTHQKNTAITPWHALNFDFSIENKHNIQDNTLQQESMVIAREKTKYGVFTFSWSKIKPVSFYCSDVKKAKEVAASIKAYKKTICN